MKMSEAKVERATPNTQRSKAENIRELFDQFVIPSYARFDLVLERGEGSYVWDVAGKRYLDLGGGIAVCCLGHAHPEVTAALDEQSGKLIHISNLYYNELQGRLAAKIVDLIGPGRVFFGNSGAEANEGLFKFARKFGHEAGRFEIITTVDSFHGRTLAGIAATGQEKVKHGFEPVVAGFKHVAFNDLRAMRDAITPTTVAILVEPVQGESGITLATSEYLLGLRRLCDEKNLLLLFDEVQSGHFRTGEFQAWQRILQGRRDDFTPDAVSMAKSLGGGFPIGAFWIREKFSNLLSSGSHASTFGGTPLACAVALRIFEVIERDHLAKNARTVGQFILDRLRNLQARHPEVIRHVRGLGLMIGIEFQPQLKAVDVVKQLHAAGVLTVPAGNAVVRLLPPLNLGEREAEEGLRVITQVVEGLGPRS